MLTAVNIPGAVSCKVLPELQTLSDVPANPSTANLFLVNYRSFEGIHLGNDKGPALAPAGFYFSTTALFGGTDFMKALVWHGKSDICYDNVPDPAIVSPRDAIIKVTSTAIYGSDLHLFNGLNPTMESGDIMGHEPMGEVVEVGSEVGNLKKGDRIVAPFTISCGSCFFCQQTLFSLCDNSNPNAEIAARPWAIRRPDYSASHICSAVMRAARRSTCECRLRMWGR